MVKIAELKDIDLSKYKLAYFHGDSCNSDVLCQNDVMALIEGGGGSLDFHLDIALIPNDRSLTECGGDDWNDSPASCNASGIYEYPTGTIFLKGNLGGQLKLTKES